MTTPTMAEQLVPDELWDAIQPLLPPKPPHPKGGRPWIQDRAVLGGIIYVLRAGVPWRLLPAKELGCGSGVTCWRRLRDWQAAGVWEACTIGCWTGWATTARSTGPGPPSTRSASGPGVGGPRWRQPGRPGQARLQVPPADRCHRPAAGGGAVGGQHPRFAAAGAHGGRRAGGHRAAGQARAAAAATGQAPWRYGL
jgi:transposase